MHRSVQPLSQTTKEVRKQDHLDCTFTENLDHSERKETGKCVSTVRQAQVFDYAERKIVMTDIILSTTHLRKSLVIPQKIGGEMKHLTSAVLLALLAASSPVFAQHVELGGFGAYSQQYLTGFADHLFGLGGRANLNGQNPSVGA